jgi:hypothetical protein
MIESEGQIYLPNGDGLWHDKPRSLSWWTTFSEECFPRSFLDADYKRGIRSSSSDFIPETDCHIIGVDFIDARTFTASSLFRPRRFAASKRRGFIFLLDTFGETQARRAKDD